MDSQPLDRRGSPTGTIFAQYKKNSSLYLARSVKLLSRFGMHFVCFICLEETLEAKVESEEDRLGFS